MFCEFSVVSLVSAVVLRPLRPGQPRLVGHRSDGPEQHVTGLLDRLAARRQNLEVDRQLVCDGE